MRGRIYIVDRRSLQWLLLAAGLLVVALMLQFSGRGWGDRMRSDDHLVAGSGGWFGWLGSRTARQGVTSGSGVTQAEPASGTLEAVSPEPGVSTVPEMKEPSVSVHSVHIEPAATAMYDQYRLERDRVRSRETELLQQVVEDPNTDEARRQASQERLLKLWGLAEKETQIEQLLRAQGMPDAVVVMGESGVNVVVPSVLTKSDVTKIGDMITRVSGLKLDQITIMDGATAQ